MRRLSLHSKNSDGFTLVELMVVLMLMSVLLGISVFGLLAWQDHTQFLQENEYASTIFSAAQEQLSSYSRSGRLLEFQERIRSGEHYLRTLNVENLTDSEGEPYEEGRVWQQTTGTLCYAACAAGDYNAYLAGTLSDEAKARGAEIVFLLLGQTINDTALLNGAICIEFTPETGQIFSALYSDRAEELTYSETSGSRVDIRNRGEAYRKNAMVGYYGVDTLAGPAAEEE
jgi:prepilin-type N-terminal cleavage/methylation domain-containing protein